MAEDIHRLEAVGEGNRVYGLNQYACLFPFLLLLLRGAEECMKPGLSLRAITCYTC